MLLALTLAAAAATTADRIGAIVYDGDRAWAESLLSQAGEELGRRIPIVGTSTGGELAELLARAQAADGADVIVALPEDRITVALVRVRDRTVLVRSFQEQTSPYALAIATAELVRLLETRAFPGAPQPGVGLGVRFSGGAEIDAAPRREGTLLVPALGVSLEIRRWIAPIEPGLVLSIRFPGPQPLGGGNGALEYRRFGVAAGLSGSLRFEVLALRASVALDVSRAQVEPREETATVARRDRTVFGVDLLLGLRFPVGAGFDLEAAAGLTMVANPAEFLLGEEIALAEGRTRIRAALALGWSTP